MFGKVDNFSDEALLLLMQNDNESALATLVNRYRQQFYRQIFRRLGSEEDSKDILQEIYLSLWNNRKSILIRDSLLPYLSRAACNIIVE
jgi:DNA-directed RNA polymerase specialized sigma24 family protein